MSSLPLPRRHTANLPHLQEHTQSCIARLLGLMHRRCVLLFDAECCMGQNRPNGLEGKPMVDEMGEFCVLHRPQTAESCIEARRGQGAHVHVGWLLVSSAKYWYPVDPAAVCWPSHTALGKENKSGWSKMLTKSWIINPRPNQIRTRSSLVKTGR